MRAPVPILFGSRRGELALISQNRLHPAFVFSRPSPAWLLDNGVLRSYANNVPRFNSVGALTLEGLRANAFLNSETFSANFSTLTGGTGTAATVVANDPTIPAPDGTFTASRLTLRVNAGTTNSDFSGYTQTVTSGLNSIWVRAVSGSPVVQIGDGLTTGHTALSTTWQRYSRAAAVFRVLGLGGLTNGVFDIMVWQPQTEAGAAFPSSNILTTGTAVTREGETLTLPLAAARLSTASGLTLYGRALLPQISLGADQTIICVDSGNNNDRFALINHLAASPTQLSTSNTSGGVFLNAQGLGLLTPSVQFNFAITIQGSRAAASLNGGATNVRTGQSAAQMTTLRVGTIAAGAAPMFGVITSLRARPFAVSDAVVRALSRPDPLELIEWP